MWRLSAPTACLLLSQFVPASARLFAEFRRVRNSLPPANARNLDRFMEKGIREGELIFAVCLRMQHEQGA